MSTCVHRAISKTAVSLGTTLTTGTVKWFNATEGDGFIRPDDGGGMDVFLRISALERSLCNVNEGAKMEHEIVSDRGNSRPEKYPA